MKVQGMVNPGSFTVEEIPGTKRSLVRLYQNVEACKIAKDAEDKEGLDGFQYDEYCVEVESWPGLAASVRENYHSHDLCCQCQLHPLLWRRGGIL